MVQAPSAIDRIASVYLRPEFARNDTARQEDPQSSRERDADARIREIRRQRLFATAADAEKAAELYGRDGRQNVSSRARSSDVEPAKEDVDLKATQPAADGSRTRIDRTA